MFRSITFSAPIGQFYGQTITTAQNTRQSVNIPKGVKAVVANSNGAFRLQLAPPLLLCCKTADSQMTFTDYTSEATDKSASTEVTLSSLDTAANGDYFYVASKYKFGGVWIDVDGANSNDVDLSGYYYADNDTWTDISITDGTDSSGTLAQDGAVTWTVPTNWQPNYLKDILPKGAAIGNLPKAAQTEKLYVVRFQVSGAVDAAVTLDEVATLADITSYPQGYFSASTDYEFNINRDEVGCIEYYDTTGSKTLTYTFVKEHTTDQ